MVAMKRSRVGTNPHVSCSCQDIERQLSKQIDPPTSYIQSVTDLSFLPIASGLSPCKSTHSFVGSFDSVICSTKNSTTALPPPGACRSWGTIISLISGRILCAISLISSSSSSNNLLEQIFTQSAFVPKYRNKRGECTRTFGAMTSDVKTGLTSLIAWRVKRQLSFF